MNNVNGYELIKYLGTHFKPIMGSYNFADVKEDFKGTGWSLENLHTLIMEAEKQDLVAISVHYSSMRARKRTPII